MSECTKAFNLVSNEDVIDELTKDLNNLTNDIKPEEYTIEPESSLKTDVPSDSGDAGHSKTDIPVEPDSTDYDPDEKHDSDKESDTESMDECSRKDAEMSLTEDEKQEQKLIAETLKDEGNKAYKVADYERSLEKYTEGIDICPLQFPKIRSVLYCNRSAAKMMLNKHKQAIKDCSKAIALDEKYVKAYIRRAKCYETTEKYDESLSDYNKILEFDPSNAEARNATVRLPPLIEERNEKLKTEMMGKLKDLGNLILKPFGLSTENFKLEQDPESKGYKINFKQ